MIPIGRNTLAKQMQNIASIAFLDGKFTNSSGRKTAIQSLRDDFDPLEISELTGHANPESMHIHLQPLSLGKTGANVESWPVSTQARQLPKTIRHVGRKIVLNTPAAPSNTAATSNCDNWGSWWDVYWSNF